MTGTTDSHTIVVFEFSAEDSICRVSCAGAHGQDPLERPVWWVRDEFPVDTRRVELWERYEGALVESPYDKGALIASGGADAVELRELYLEVVSQAMERAGEQARKAVAIETNNPDVEVRLINSAIVSLHIDGYKISNPIGFKGSDVAIQFYTAFAPLVHVSAIEKVCAELNLDLLAVAVEPFAVCRACLGDELDSNFSGIVVDIGGGTTDVAVVDDGGVEGTKMFSIGGRSFTHQIAEGLGCDFDTAERYKLLLEHPGKIEPELRPKIDAAIERNLEVWLSGIVITLEEFDVEDMLPGRILLCGGGAGLTRLQEELATTDWAGDLPFARRPIIHLVTPEEIPGIVNTTDTPIDHSFITALGLLRVALDTLGADISDDGLRGKLAKLLQN